MPRCWRTAMRQADARVHRRPCAISGAAYPMRHCSARFGEGSPPAIQAQTHPAHVSRSCPQAEKAFGSCGSDVNDLWLVFVIQKDSLRRAVQVLVLSGTQRPQERRKSDETHKDR